MTMTNCHIKHNGTTYHRRTKLVDSGRALLVEIIVSIIWILLNCIDFILLLLSLVTKALFWKEKNGHKPKVVIVGASFAGLAVEQILSNHLDELDVTIIDYKSYFEYVPGALRCFVDPSYFSKAISCPLSVLNNKNGATVVEGKVINVKVSKNQEDKSKNEVILDDGSCLSFDYLVLAAGSTYPSPIKAIQMESTLQRRQTQWDRAAKELGAARSVLIIGGGAVGVELAGEILTKYSDSKRIVLMDMSTEILPFFSKSSVKYAQEWLERRGVEMKMGVSIDEIGEKIVLLRNGEKFEVDLIYKCFGARPNTEFLQMGPLGSALTGPKESLEINDNLQVEGYDHVFCAGDMCYHAGSNEINLGHTAELKGHLVAENILLSARCPNQQAGETLNLIPNLLTYPDGVVGNKVSPFIYDVSLGKYNATLGFNSLIINGTFAAVMKWLIEWTKVAAAKRRPVGILFWKFADFVANYLGRTVIPSHTKNNS